jgi:hypothetical protein
MNEFMEGWRDAYNRGKFNKSMRGNEEYERGFNSGMDSFERW